MWQPDPTTIRSDQKMSPSSPPKSAHRRYLPWLIALFSLFVFRVVAQLLQSVYPVSFLPSYSAWHSGALPYGSLVLSQLLIIMVFSLTIRGFARESVRPKRRLGQWLLVLGGFYFGTMILRLLAGLTIAADHPWFGAKIPAFFHIVLASFILLVGHFHLKQSDET